ncbi:hypothetical protein B484DRAFT_430838 [Ochromonadaceae sp. CCMP2298]|nr:hypothetical protein B484DRAFT_430838 [Ochromonadaceae sp. CCMP2298]
MDRLSFPSDAVLAAIGFAGSIAVALSLQSHRKRTKFVRVSKLYVYPIKSCRGVEVQSAEVTPRGFHLDRIFMVCDENGKFVSQRTHPAMALVDVQISEDAGSLIVTAPGMAQLVVPTLFPTTVEGMQTVKCTVWGDACEGIEILGAQGSCWFSTYLKTPHLKFVRMTDSVRPTDPEYAPKGQTSFSDGFPFLLASKSSLSSTNKKLKLSSTSVKFDPLTMARFRPNIVVSGSKAFAEDTWDLLRVAVKTHTGAASSLDMSVVKPCARCTIPNINPATAQVSEDREPSRSMLKFRSGEAAGFSKESWKKQLFFGQNLDHGGRSGVTVSTGALIEIVSADRRFRVTK